MLSHSGDIYKDNPKEQLGSFQLLHSLSQALQLSHPQLAHSLPKPAHSSGSSTPGLCLCKQ